MSNNSVHVIAAKSTHLTWDLNIFKRTNITSSAINYVKNRQSFSFIHVALCYSVIFKMNNSSTFLANFPVYSLTTEEWILYVIFFIIFGIFGTACNSLVLYLIVKDKKLYTFFYMMLAGHTLNRAVYCFEYIILGAQHLLGNYFSKFIFMSRFQCHTLYFLTYFSNSYSSVTMFMLAVDRVYSLGRPKSYHKRSAKQGIFLVAGSAIITFLTKMLPSYAGSVPFTTTILCIVTQSSVTEGFFNYNYYTNLFLALFAIVLYTILFSVAFFRKKMLARNLNDQIACKTLKRQLVLLDSIRLLIILNFLTVLPFNVIQILSEYFESRFILIITTVGGCFSSTDRLFDPLILLWKSSDIRRSFNLNFTKTSKVNDLTKSVSA